MLVLGDSLSVKSQLRTNGIDLECSLLFLNQEVN